MNDPSYLLEITLLWSFSCLRSRAGLCSWIVVMKEGGKPNKLSLTPTLGVFIAVADINIEVGAPEKTEYLNLI